MIYNNNDDNNIRNNGNSVVDIALSGTSFPLFLGRIGIWSVGFCEGRKTKGAGESTTNSTLLHM